MDEAAIKPKRKTKAEGDQALRGNEWWDMRGHQHPLSDADFVRVFCEHVFLTSTDITLRTVRDRAFRFIRQFMNPDMERELTRYREVHS